MKKINMMGQPCPIPVIETKKVLGTGSGAVVSVDNIIAVQNLEKMAKGSGYTFSYDEIESGHYEVTMGVDADTPVSATTQSTEGQTTKEPGFVIMIGSNQMGNGSEELGKLLMKGYIYSLTQLEQLPDTVIFLNSGAYLTCGEANTVSDLQALEKNGVEVFTCGTCANHYGLKDSLAVGTITDMYHISTKMATAARIITI